MKNLRPKIEVLSTGCPICVALWQEARKAAREMGIKTEVVYVTDISRGIELGMLTVPVLVVNDRPVSWGKFLTAEEIKEILKKNLDDKESYRL